MERLKVQSIVDEIQTYQKSWKEHVARMQDGRSAVKYQPTSGKAK
jgi:hypothetical protein